MVMEWTHLLSVGRRGQFQSDVDDYVRIDALDGPDVATQISDILTEWM
jgi:hypothetical protein